MVSKWSVLGFRYTLGEDEFANYYGVKLCAFFVKEGARTACGRLALDLCMQPLRHWLKAKSGKYYAAQGRSSQSVAPTVKQPCNQLAHSGNQSVNQTANQPDICLFQGRFCKGQSNDFKWRGFYLQDEQERLHPLCVCIPHFPLFFLCSGIG